MKKIISCVLVMVVGLMTACSGKSGYEASIELANKYMLDGNYTEAILEFKKAIEIEPNKYEPYEGLVNAYISLNSDESVQGIVDAVKAYYAVNSSDERLIDYLADNIENMTDDLALRCLYELNDEFDNYNIKDKTKEYESILGEEAEQIKKKYNEYKENTYEEDETNSSKNNSKISSEIAESYKKILLEAEERAKEITEKYDKDKYYHQEYQYTINAAGDLFLIEGVIDNDYSLPKLQNYRPDCGTELKFFRGTREINKLERYGFGVGHDYDEGMTYYYFPRSDTNAITACYYANRGGDPYSIEYDKELAENYRGTGTIGAWQFIRYATYSLDDSDKVKVDMYEKSVGGSNINENVNIEYEHNGEKITEEEYEEAIKEIAYYKAPLCTTDDFSLLYDSYDLELADDLHKSELEYGNDKNENSNKNKVIFTIGEKDIFVYGDWVDIDCAPYINTKMNATMIPIKYAISAITNNKGTVEWNPETKITTVHANGKNIQFQCYNSYVNVDGKEINMGEGIHPEIANSWVYVPYNILGEVLDVKCWYDDDIRSIIYEK